MSKITVNQRHEQLTIVVIGERTFWESVPQGHGSQEEAAWVELASQQRNTNQMMVIYSMCMAWRFFAVKSRTRET